MVSAPSQKEKKILKIINSKKGKIFKGSFGKSRPASDKKTTGNTPAVKKEA